MDAHLVFLVLVACHTLVDLKWARMGNEYGGVAKMSNTQRLLHKVVVCHGEPTPFKRSVPKFVWQMHSNKRMERSSILSTFQKLQRNESKAVAIDSTSAHVCVVNVSCLIRVKSPSFLRGL